MSTLNVDKVDPSTGTALEIGSSGDTITVPSGATFAVSGTMNASSITAGTLAIARGGTGSTSDILGKIGQVVEVIHTSNSFTTSDSFADLFTIAITPSATTSKVLVFLLGQYNLYGNGASTSGIGTILLTDSSDVTLSSTYVTNVFPSDTGQMDSSFNLFNISSPASTSEQTYKCRYKASSSGQRLGIMGGSARENGTRLLAMEILA